MIRVVLIALFACAGWVLGRLTASWSHERRLLRRIRRQRRQQDQLWQAIAGECDEDTGQPVRCICEWFDADTLIRNPDCKASDHGRIEALCRYLMRLQQARESRHRVLPLPNFPKE